MLALVGGNGAGKSTTMRVLAGVVPAERRDRRWWTGSTSPPTRWAPSTAPATAPTSAGCCRGPRRGSTCSCRRRCAGLTDWQARAEHLLKRFELADVADRVTAGFSHGMGRRMSVVLAGLHRPPVLLLDEPFDGVDPLGVEATFELVDDLASSGTAVLVSTHQLDLATQVARDAVVLRGGTVVGRCTTEELVGREGARRYRELLGS